MFAGHRLYVLLGILFDMFIRFSYVPQAFCESTMMIGLLYNEAQQDAKVAQTSETTLTYILTVHKNEKIPVPDVSGFRSQTVES